MSRAPTSPNTFTTPPRAASVSGPGGLGRPGGVAATDGGSGHRYTSLSSLMRSPDRDARMEWSGSPSSFPTGMLGQPGQGQGGQASNLASASASPLRTHFAPMTRPTPQIAPRLAPGNSAVTPADVPPWTIPGNGDRPPRTSPAAAVKKNTAHLSWWRILALTVAMGGSQIVWTVELGYGTPYLLGLGLEEKYTALVWLAGPISGLVVQPLIGAISDSSTSRYRRRFWVVASTMLLVLSLLGLAYTEPMAKAIADLIGAGQGDWDPKGQAFVKKMAIAIAVFSFYTLDFALNGLQASLRNLVFDVTPADQLNSANAWNGRFNHIGNIVGFFMGYMDLNGVPILRLLGGDQFRKLSMVSLLILLVTVWITCFTTEEDERPSDVLTERRSTLRHMLNTIHEAILTLPKPVRRICMVQIMAFMGWFPFLFYTTLYVRYVMSYQLGRDADEDVATRAGSFALLIHAFVAYGAGTILPYLSEREQRLLPDDEDEAYSDEDEHARVRALVQQWKADVATSGRRLRLPRMPFMLRNVWTAALLLFFVLMMSTFFIVNVVQATIMISLVGICWAVACWVPFEMIMAFLKELEKNQNGLQDSPTSSTSYSAVRSTSLGNEISHRPRPSPHDERRPLLMRSYSTADLEGASAEYIGQGPVAGGTIMGIHNLAIVLPQFIIAIVASIIFRLADGDRRAAGSFEPPPNQPTPGYPGGPDPVYHEKSGVAWVLRFGGLMALVGAAVCRSVPPTKQEKIMRRRLAEMRDQIERDEE